MSAQPAGVTVLPTSTCKDATGADTVAFLALLSRLRKQETASAEETAAAALFDWTRELVVARAPGRLDVRFHRPWRLVAWS